MDNTKASAFPISLAHPDVEFTPGLTKLEAFTMAAMQGICANSIIERPVGPGQTQEGVIAQIAVDIARATLSELSKQQQP